MARRVRQGPSAILRHHWPDVPNHGDVKTTDWTTVEPVDILTAGYPASRSPTPDSEREPMTPTPLARRRRAIRVLRPGLVVLENVRGHVSLGLADVLGDPSALGYDATWGVVRASDAGAPHGRARIFIVAATDADATGTGLDGSGNGPADLGQPARTLVADPDGRRRRQALTGTGPNASRHGRQPTLF